MERNEEDSIQKEEVTAEKEIAVPEEQGDEEIDDLDEDGMENGSGDKDADDEEVGDPLSGDEDEDEDGVADQV